IQSCGYLLAVVEEAGTASSDFPSGLRIIGASQNVETIPWVDVSAAAVLHDKDLGYVFQAGCLGTVRSLVARHRKSCKLRYDRVSTKADRNKADIYPCFAPTLHAQPHLPVVNEHRIEGWTCTVADSNPGVYLIEIEPKKSPHPAGRELIMPDVLLQTTTAADLLGYVPVGANPEDTTAALCAAFMEALPAYDRVMVYRFAPDGTGEIIAESIRPGSETKVSYLNLRFPAEDIPPKTREMLKLNGVRFIADTSARGVPVRVFDEKIAAPLDLTMSALRAPPDCHLTYLLNMGVKASMTVGIVVNGELWGLYVCHGCTRAVHPVCEERVVMEMAATVTASLITKHRVGEVAMTSLSLSRTLGKISQFTKVKHFLAAEHRALLSILDVDTIILSENLRSVTVYGNKEFSLTVEDCKGLARLDGGLDGAVMLGSMETKGVAFFSVRSFFVAFLRGSIARHVKWAGKPDPPLTGREEWRLSPRASFDLYMETTAAQFKAWSPATVDLLEMVSQSLSSHAYAEALPVDLQEVFEQVSHELRTPFHGVMASLDMLKGGHGAMDAQEQLSIIKAAIECGGSMMSSLNNILDIAKDCNNIDVAQDQSLPSSPILLTVAAMTPFAKSESLELVANIGAPADGFLEVIGDERRIKAILQNLVTNAIKFTPRGGEVKISLVMFDSLEEGLGWWTKVAGRFNGKVLMGNVTDDDNNSDDDNVKNNDKDDPGTGEEPSLLPLAAAKKCHAFCVEDSGAGVLSSNLPHLVAPYRQMLYGSHPGTGLGLHICKEYVEIMNGAFGIASTLSEEGRPGGGSMFVVLLPLCLAEVKAESPAPAPPGLEPRMTKEAAPIALLQHKIGMCFKASNACRAEVLIAADGLLALDVLTTLRSTQPSGDDAVLAGMFVDMNMPNLDGVECTKRVRLLEEENGWLRMPIYGCTANIRGRAQQIFQGAGVDGVLPKPWQRGQVEDVCTAMVEQFLEAEKHKAAGGAG
ncbi:unnamed protein product, partial [Pylaiella littoralis]